MFVNGAIGLAAGGAAGACVAAAVATLVPRHGVAMTMGWLAVVDFPLHVLDFGVRHISTSFGAAAIGGFAPDASILSGALTLVVLSLLGVALACWRISQVE
jgi:hypothetical protein